AGRNGTLIVDTFGSDFDTYLTVATGVVVSNLAVLAQNDDARGTLQSEIVLHAVAGTTYQIAVDGYLSATGSIALNLVPEPSAGLLRLGGLGALLALRRFAARGIGSRRSTLRR
nr:hypothetical protein [Myxococcota bacterium]